MNKYTDTILTQNQSKVKKLSVDLLENWDFLLESIKSYFIASNIRHLLAVFSHIFWPLACIISMIL